MPRTAFHRSLADIPAEVSFGGLMQRSAVRTDGALVTFNRLHAGFDGGPPHAHPFDELALVFGGVLCFELSGERYAVGDGELLYIPSDISHTARVHGSEPVLNINVFAPDREDYADLVDWQDHETT